MAAIADLTDEQFLVSLNRMQTSMERVRTVQKQVMVAGRDFGIIPGTKKPTLYKPGAEILTLVYNYVAQITTERILGDNVSTPLIRHDATTYLRIGGWDGPIVAVGYGTCNSWETKYRYRTEYGALICPGCHKAGLIKTKEKPASGSKPARPEQYWHPADAKPDGGCGENFPIATPVTRIEGGKIENPDPWENDNTILKMSEKRSHVEAIQRATGTSGLFATDEETGDKAETPDQRSRREFNEWIAALGLDPREDVLPVGVALFGGNDVLKTLEPWQRSLWRAEVERRIDDPEAKWPAQPTTEGPRNVTPQEAPQQPAAAAQPPTQPAAAPTPPAAPATAPAATLPFTPEELGDLEG